MNTIGNLFAGRVVNETGDKLARRFGKNNQEKQSTTQTKDDTTINISTQQADMIPASKIATMKQGEFAGQVGDEVGQEINLKTFKSYIHVDPDHYKKTQHELPKIHNFDALLAAKFSHLFPPDVGQASDLSDDDRRGFIEQVLEEHYFRIRDDIKLIVDTESSRHGIQVEKTD